MSEGPITLNEGPINEGPINEGCIASMVKGTINIVSSVTNYVIGPLINDTKNWLKM